MEQIDEADVRLLGDLPHGVGIFLEVGVMGLAVGDVRVVQIFVGDRRNEDHPRRAFAAVVLGLGLFDQPRQIDRESFQPRWSGERFIEAEEEQNHVGLAVLQVFVGLAEIERAVAR